MAKIFLRGIFYINCREKEVNKRRGKQLAINHRFFLVRCVFKNFFIGNLTCRFRRNGRERLFHCCTLAALLSRNMLEIWLPAFTLHLQACLTPVKLTSSQPDLRSDLYTYRSDDVTRASVTSLHAMKMESEQCFRNDRLGCWCCISEWNLCKHFFSCFVWCCSRFLCYLCVAVNGDGGSLWIADYQSWFQGSAPRSFFLFY